MSRRLILAWLGVFAAGLMVLTACTSSTGSGATSTSAPATSGAGAQPTRAPSVAPTTNIGTADKPIKMLFVPSADSQKVLSSGKPLADLLEKETGYKFDVSVPTSYSAVIEAMGAGQADVAWFSPFAYALAHQKYGAEVILTTVRNGSKTYRSQIIVRADSGINTLEDLKGKKFAFVDPVSASGFLYPAALLKDKGIDYNAYFSQVVYAGGHDKVVIAVYNNQVDGGATFGDSVDNQQPPTDARTNVVNTLPDVLEKVKPIATTDPIPNDTVSVRKDLPKEVSDKLRAGLLKIAGTDDGKKLLKDLYNITGLAEAKDADYEPLRKKAQAVGLNLEEAIKPAATPTPRPQ